MTTNQKPNRTADPALARNQSELARLLNVNRQLISWHAFKPEAPRRRADGRLDVKAWRLYLDTHARPGGASETPALTEARLQGELLSNWRREFRNRILQGEYLPKAEIFRVCGQAIQAAKTRSFSGLPRLVALVRLAKDDESALKSAREEMIAVWRAMESCDWFKPQEAPKQ